MQRKTEKNKSKLTNVTSGRMSFLSGLSAQPVTNPVEYQEKKWKLKLEKEFKTTSPREYGSFHFYTILLEERERFVAYLQDNNINALVKHGGANNSLGLSVDLRNKKQSFHSEKDALEFFKKLNKFTSALDEKSYLKILNSLLSNSSFSLTTSKIQSIFHDKLLATSLLAASSDVVNLKNDFKEILSSIFTYGYRYSVRYITIQDQIKNISADYSDKLIAEIAMLKLVSEIFLHNVMLSLSKCNAKNLLSIILDKLPQEEKQMILPLLTLESISCLNVDITKMLLSKGADLNSYITLFGEANLTITPIFKFINECLYSKINAARLEMLDLLISQGADLDKSNFVDGRLSWSTRQFCQEKFNGGDHLDEQIPILIRIIHEPSCKPVTQLDSTNTDDKESPHCFRPG